MPSVAPPTREAQRFETRRLRDASKEDALVEQEDEGRRADTLVVRGGLSDAEVQRIFAAQRSAIARLVARSQWAKTGRPATVTLRWFVTADGAVIQPKVVHSTAHDAELERKLVQEVRGWRFPPPPRGGHVEVILTLTLPL